MNKKLTRPLSGVLSLLMLSQIMVFGDGNAQGILHADTLASAAEAIEEAKNADALAADYEDASEGLGDISYFSLGTNSASVTSLEDEEVSYASTLTVTGYIKRGTVSGYNLSDDTPIYVYIFNSDWEEVASCEAAGDGSYNLTGETADGVYHVKYECDGYLPFYLKDFGTGIYQVGSGESLDTVTLVPGNTTYNADSDNQWSDDNIDSNDLAYVQSCEGAYRGDSDFNPSMDLDGDGIVSQTDLDTFCVLYSDLGEDSWYEIPSDILTLDINGDGLINDTDYDILYDIVYGNASADGYTLPELDGIDNLFTEGDLDVFESYLEDARTVDSCVYIFNHDMNGDGIVDSDDYDDCIDIINAMAQRRGRSDNYYEYMDKDSNGTIEAYDIGWFSAAYASSGDLNWDMAFKRSLTVLENGYFPYSLNLHDTNLDLNGYEIYVEDCMSFTTDIPEFWSNGAGAYLDIHGGCLTIVNNLVFRTASSDGWSGNAGQTMNLNGGAVLIGGDFNFGQINCYDTILMTDDNDILIILGNWNYITLTDMEGKWTAGQIWFLGPIWEVNEASGDKSIYSSGTQSIIFGYDGGLQTILWDNCETYINNEDGTLNTERTFNFEYEYGIIFLYDFTAENYWFRPWFREYDEPDYTLYRKGWKIGDSVHIATGNYTKSFTDLSVSSPGVTSDFVRTYNSMSDEEGSFGVGWDFNIDVSKIVIPADGYYQVVLPDGSNTTFKDDEKGGFECLNAHSTMTKSGDEYAITNAAQSQYHFNADGELDWVKDAEGNILTISALSNNQRIVTDSTGRTYTITYNGDSEHSRITSIEDTEADRIVMYAYNSDNQLISATSVSGGTEYYEYDGNGRLCKITNCYEEVTDQIVYNENGSVNWLTNAAGLKQVYTYNSAFKQTGLQEYDGDTLVKTYTYDYDEKYAVTTNTVTTDGETYEVDKITYSTVDGENKYDEMIESVDIMGNTTKYDRDDNGNVTKTTNADGTYTLANYNSKNSVIAEVDEMGYATIYAYDSNGTRLLKQESSLNPLSQSDINTVTSSDFDPVTYLAANESSYAITSNEYYADSYVSGAAGLIRATTDPEGNGDGV